MGNYIGIWLHPSFYIIHTFYIFTNRDMPIYFVGRKILLEAAQLQNWCISLSICVYCTCIPHVVWQTKCELVLCITCVSCVFTGNWVHAKIVCNSACICQFLKVLHVVNMQKQGCSRWSSWPGFGWNTTSLGKNKILFYRKQVMNKSFGLVQLVVITLYSR